MKKVILIILILVLSVNLLVGCNHSNGSEIIDIITQKLQSSDKIDITILVKYAFGINTFEKEIEKKFNNLNIIQVGNYTSDMGINEYYAKMKNDDLTDIVMTWPLDVGKEYWEDRLLDLSTLSATSRYTTKSLNNIAVGQAGKLYYLPGPAQVRGIIYNKTLFKENNWEMPTNYEEFIELCKTIEKSGLRSLQLGLANSEVLDTAFTGYGFGDSYATPESAKAIDEYNEGRGTFKDNFMPALETFKKFVDEGILKEEDLTISYSDREKMFFSRECAMIEDSVLMARMGGDLTGTGDEFALMPFFNPGEFNDWARLYDVCFIGANKHLLDSGNEKKLAMVKQIIDYISTPEGQASLSGDTGAMFSSLKGVSPPEVVEIEAMQTALNAGRYGVFPTLKNAQSALREGLAGIIKKTHTLDMVVKMVDKQNLNPPIVSPPLVVGSASSNFSLIETGNFVTDSMREYADSEIALFLDNGKDGLYNGKGLSGKLYRGDITYSDLKRILPDLKYNEKGELFKITMTGENLIKTLEYSIAVNNEKNGWFYYFSGLKMEFDPVESPGKRIKSIVDNSGKAIDLNKVYTIAIMDDIVVDKYTLSKEAMNITILSVLEKKIAKAKSIMPTSDNRFIIK